MNHLEDTKMNPSETTTELANLVEASGVEKSKQNKISETLGVFFAKASEWDATIQSIVITSPKETGKMKMAREGRLTLRDMRLDGERAVKLRRDEIKYKMANDVLEDKLWLKAGQMMEATFKNLETKLEEKETFKIRWDAERTEERRVERLAQLIPLGFQSENGFRLGDMDESIFKSLKLGLESSKKEREDAERKEEESRIALAKAEAAAKARMEAENKRLKKEAEEAEKLIQEARVMAIATRREMEEKAQKAEELANAELRLQKEANDRLQAEIKAKADAEEADRRKAEEVAAHDLRVKQQAEAKALKAPREQKLNKWIDGFTVGVPAGMDADRTVIEIVEKFDAFKVWAKTKIETS